MSCLAVSAEAMVLPVRHTALRCLVLVIGVLWSATATGSGRPGRFVGLRLERLDASTCDDGLVRAHVTDVAIDGEIRRRPAGSYRLLLPDGQLLRAEREQDFVDTAAPLFIALVLETGLPYAGDLERIKAEAARFVSGLPASSRISLISYGGEVSRLRSRQPPHMARAALDRVEPDTDAVGLALVEALRLAIRDLERAPATARRMIVVVSDGINRVPDWDLFRAAGSRARRAGVTISPIAYSPIDERGPLLNLGELAKRSGGTFRWARTVTQIARQLRNLGEQITRQRVLTYRVPGGCRQPQPVRIAAGQLRSEAATLVAVSGAARSDSRRSWLAWGGLAAAVVLLAAVTWLLVRGLRSTGRGI